VLSSSAASTDLHGTQAIGLYGKIRSMKAVCASSLLLLFVFFESVAILLFHVLDCRLQFSRCWKNRWVPTLFKRWLSHCFHMGCLFIRTLEL
jgi:hypothetical protein